MQTLIYLLLIILLSHASIIIAASSRQLGGDINKKWLEIASYKQINAQ